MLGIFKLTQKELGNSSLRAKRPIFSHSEGPLPRLCGGRWTRAAESVPRVVHLMAVAPSQRKPVSFPVDKWAMDSHWTFCLRFFPF